MATEPFIGHWQIVTCVPDFPNNADADVKALQGCKFELTADGDVYWHPIDPLGREVPLFHCETYEVLREREGISVIVRLRFAAYQGHVIEFNVGKERALVPSIGLSLTYPGLYILHCQQIRGDYKQSNEIDHVPKHLRQPFDLLTCLQDELFADAEIVSDSRRSFKVHRLILKAALPQWNWTEEDMHLPLSGAPDIVLSTMLHFLYSQSLPESESLARLKETADFVREYPHFQAFVKKVENYERKSKVCNKLKSLINDIYWEGEHLLKFVDPHSSKSHRSESSMYPSILQSPSKTTTMLKLCLRYCLITFVKMSHVGKLYLENKTNLSSDEQHEVIDFVKSCLPLFLKQIKKFWDILRRGSSVMNMHSKQELATHLVPEVEALIDILHRIGSILKELIESILAEDSASFCRGTSGPSTRESSFNHEGTRFPLLPDSYQDNINTFTRKLNVSGKFTSMQNTMAIKDLFNFKMVHKYFLMILSYVEQERESFDSHNENGKARLICWEIDQIIDELPLFVLKLEEFINMLDRLQFGTFKFCFILGTSFLENVLDKLKRKKAINQPFLELLCSFVDSDSFKESLSELGLLDISSQASSSQRTTKSNQQSIADSDFPSTVFHRSLSFDKWLCQPPCAVLNDLAKGVAKLLEDIDSTDMTITVHECDPEGIKDIEVTDIHCHSVIMASRCSYFRRALTSGMREAIEKRFDVYDTTLEAFKRFLRFVYSGNLDFENFSLDSCSELLMLADRYELDQLKDVCEAHLELNIDMDNALTLLGIGDQFNGARLKAKALEYVLENPELIDLPAFYELDESLQAELNHLNNWGHSAAEKTMNPVPEGFSRLINVTAQMRLRDNAQDDLERIPLTHDSSQLEECVAGLREVLGPLIDQEELVRASLAADYDLNRAINYLLNSED